MSQLDAVLAHIDADQPQALDRLFKLLRIDSVSTDPAYADSCRKAADLLTEDLKSIGFDARCDATPGHPMVVAHSGGSGRHVLFYGHYDVQPVDPLELWDRPPFDPEIQDTPAGKVIRGRGTADDKGQLMTFVEACRAWKAVTGSLPANVSILFEGEEESGSPSLIPYLEAHRDELAAEVALVCDTSMWDADTPSISTRLRGILSEQVTLKAANKDLHSGYFGGPAANPIRILARILAGLHDETGRVTLPGFYDGIEPLPAEIKAQWDALNFDAEKFLGEVGLSVPAGEQGYSALEQIWARPTCEFNGIKGGYIGEGFKTVLPAEAQVKISCRLVSKQDPVKIRAALRAYVESQLPADVTVEFRGQGGSYAVELETDTPIFAATQKALTEEWEKDAVFSGMGGSIPIVGHFDKILGMNSLLVGFGLEDDQIHSPNEKYALKSYHKGIRSWARILAAL